MYLNCSKCVLRFWVIDWLYLKTFKSIKIKCKIYFISCASQISSAHSLYVAAWWLLFWTACYALAVILSLMGFLFSGNESKA